MLAGCGGGGGGGGSPSPSPAPVDTTPDTITFTNQSGTATSTVVSSNQVTVTGINSAASISITGGEYSIAGGAFTSAPGTVSNNQTVTVRVNTPAQFSTQASATLTVGGVTAVFTVTTLAADTTPDAYQFQNSVNTARGVVITSNSVTITGLNSSSPVTITGGEYSIEGGAFTAAAGNLTNNQRIQVRVTSSGQFSTPASATLSVGGVTGVFTATTLAEDTTPDAFAFQRTSNNVRGSLVVSNTVSITGINNTTPVAIQNGEYSVAGGAYRTAAGTLEPGQSITVRARASSVYSKSTQATVTIGGVSADFVVSAELPGYTPDDVEFDGTDVVFLLSATNRLVFRWSLAEARYLDPYELSQSLDAPTLMAWSGAHQRLYFGYSGGAIRYVNPAASSPTETHLVTLAGGLFSLSSAGNFLAVQTSQYSYSGGRVVSSSGVVTASQAGYYYGYSRQTAWDPVTSRLYYYRDGISPNDLHYDVINQTTGQITSSGETPYHGDYSFSGVIRVSANGQRVLLGTGDLYGQSNMYHTGWLGNPVNDARWMADGSLITLRTANNQTVLRRRASNTQVTLEQLPFTGDGLRVVGTDARMAVLVVNNGALQIHTYVPSDDSDGDGVSNTEDAFPMDVAASVDTDRDGYPDAWNSGRSQADSTSGLSLDAFAQDSACWLASHGNAGACNYTATLPDYEPVQVISHGDIVYLLSRDNRRVYRWSISAGRYLNPYVVGNDQDFSTFVPTMITYSSAHQRLYLVYPTGDINYIDVTASSPVEVPFTSMGGVVTQVASAGNFIVAHVSTNYYTNYSHVIDSSGVVRDLGGSYYSATDIAWDPVTSRLYYVVSSYNLFYDVINQSTGEVTSIAQSIPGGANLVRPARVSVNGQRILLGSGDLFSGTAWTGSLGAQLADARWFADGSLVTLTTASNQTALRRLDGSTLGTLEQLPYTGRALRVVGSDTRMAVVLFDGDTVQFHIYVPDNDSDDDGVQNTSDAFPLDVAASVDTDRDGYPDEWNSGRSQADSTSVPQLVLDAFEDDSACWLPSHAGAGGACNYGATIPNYIPDQVVQADNVVYLLSAANKRVYRWSISAGAYINPYVVGANQGFTTLAPTKMEYSANHQRLYLGYSNGAIRYLDVTSGTPVETPFVTMGGAVNRLTSAGNFLVAHAGYYYSSLNNYVIDSAGVTRDTGGSYYGGYETSWDPVNSRLYYTASGYYSLYYDVINQSTGEFGTTVNSPYYNTYLSPPIRVSPDGQRILLGSGTVLSHSNLIAVGFLTTQFTDARWFADDSVALLVQTGNLTTLIHQAVANTSLETRQYPGQPLRIVGSDTAMAVLVLNNGAVQIHSYVPSTDSDGDGVLNTSDAFPVDVAASVDADGDGHPDAWNAGYTQADSTTGLTLDLFPADITCWAANHGSGGVCDYDAAISPNYRPDLIAQDGDIVYLLSSVNRRVYRWSIATGEYLSPYVVGGNLPYASLAPTAMAYSPAHQRLYLGYSTGAVRYIDLNAATPVETAFTTLSERVNVLADAGNFLLAQPTGNVAGLVLNSNGVTMDTNDYYYGYSTETAWDPVSSRVYYVGSGTLRYQVIDQTTGQIGATGESAYSGQAFGGPIRVSPDGSQIVLGNGNVYARNGLTLTGSLGKAVVDVQWKDNLIVDVDSTALVEIRDATTRAVLQTHQQVGAPLRLAFGSSDAYLVHLLNDTAVAFWRMPFYDDDGDGILRWWEQLYSQGGAGMSDGNPNDATTDLDSDGVNNLLEYQNHSNPLVTDTDADGLSDPLEIVAHHTNPAVVDTDGDGLSDHAEVVTHLTDPLDTDSDNDNFSDQVEVLYGGNPNDVTVLPQPLTSYSQTFEGSPNLSAWITPAQAGAPWAVNTSAAHSGSASFRSGAVGNSQTSSVRFRGYLRPGVLTFWTRVDNNYCCNRMYVSLNGVHQHYITSGSQWYPYTVTVPTVGVHEIEWRFERDYYGGQPTESAWIDDVVFVGQ